MGQSNSNGSWATEHTFVDRRLDDANLVDSGKIQVSQETQDKSIKEGKRGRSDSQILMSDFNIDHPATEYDKLSVHDTDVTPVDLDQSPSTENSSWQHGFLASLPLQNPLVALPTGVQSISDAHETGMNGLSKDDSEESDSGFVGSRNIEYRKGTPSARLFNPLSMNPVDEMEMDTRPSRGAAEVDVSNRLEAWGLVPANDAKDSYPIVQDTVDAADQESNSNVKSETEDSNGKVQDSGSGWDFRKKLPAFDAFFNLFSSSSSSEEEDDSENSATAMDIDPPPPRPSSPSPASPQWDAYDNEDVERMIAQQLERDAYDHYNFKQKTSQQLQDQGIRKMDPLAEVSSDSGSDESFGSAEPSTERADSWAEAYLSQHVLDTDPEYAGLECLSARTARTIVLDRALYPARRSSRYPSRKNIVIQRARKQPHSESSRMRKVYSAVEDEHSQGKENEDTMDVSVNF